jgi:hypothetical protein
MSPTAAADACPPYTFRSTGPFGNLPPPPPLPHIHQHPQPWYARTQAQGAPPAANPARRARWEGSLPWREEEEQEEGFGKLPRRQQLQDGGSRWGGSAPQQRREDASSSGPQHRHQQHQHHHHHHQQQQQQQQHEQPLAEGYGREQVQLEVGTGLQVAGANQHKDRHRRRHKRRRDSSSSSDGSRERRRGKRSSKHRRSKRRRGRSSGSSSDSDSSGQRRSRRGKHKRRRKKRGERERLHRPALVSGRVGGGGREGQAAGGKGKVWAEGWAVAEGKADEAVGPVLVPQWVAFDAAPASSTGCCGLGQKCLGASGVTSVVRCVALSPFRYRPVRLAAAYHSRLLCEDAQHPVDCPLTASSAGHARQA